MRTCLSCGGGLPAKPPGVGGQPRKTCSRECANAWRRARYTPKGRRPFRDPLEVRFWRKVAFLPTGCWEWQGSRTPANYGQIGLGRSELGLEAAHRVSWEMHHQERIPDGLFVRHTCDNPPCVNPWHLVLGTHEQNMQDALDRGRTARGFRLPHTKLSDEQVREIRRRYDPQGGSTGLGGTRSNAQVLADEFGISRVYVMQLVHGWYRKDVA